MTEINPFTQASIELATQRNYLDMLYKVYPLLPDSVRTIDKLTWANVEKYYKANDNEALFRELLKLELFPIKDGYIPFFRKYPDAIKNNPNTVNRICGRIHDLDLDKLYERCTTPKETNRQMGPLFGRWVKSGVLGMGPMGLQEFESTNENAILSGTDEELKLFAEDKLDFKRENNKRPDFICRINKRYVIGEAKFLSDEGGHQKGQFEDAMNFIDTKAQFNVVKIAILDGILYIPSNREMYTRITSHDLPVMSALLLREFLYSL